MCATRRLIGPLGGLLVAAGCAGTTAPSGFLPSPEEARTEAFGGWIELQVRSNGRDHPVEGELLAVTRDSVWVLRDTAWVAVATATVREGKLTGYDSHWGGVAGYTALGVVSTIANGWFLAFTAPAWIVTGTLSAAGQSRLPQRKTPPLAWSDLAVFARFPQGMPAGIGPGDLRPKPRGGN